MIQQESGTSMREMLQVFNCGHRMELYMDAQAAQDIIQISQSFGIDAKIVGHVLPASSKKLTVTYDGTQYEFWFHI